MQKISNGQQNEAIKISNGQQDEANKIFSDGMKWSDVYVYNQYTFILYTHNGMENYYHPFEILHLDHIGPLKVDDKGHWCIFVIIDVVSWWVELFPTTRVPAL